MPDQAVSSIVESILDSFQSSSELVERADRRHRRKHSKNHVKVEPKLDNALTERPKEIKQSYDQNVAKHGRTFEQGDGKSQATLAHILMVLNTGLLKLINHSLVNDKHTSQRDSIFELSETAATDTLHALAELNYRLTTASKLNLALMPAKQKPQDKAPDAKAAAAQDKKCETQALQPVMRRRRPSASPRLANGGWVRSKSSPSVVSVVAAPRSVAARNAGRPRQNSAFDHDRQRKKSHSPGPKLLSVDDKAQERNLPYTAASQDKVSPRPRHAQPVEPFVRHPSMILVPADLFDSYVAHYDTTTLPRYESPPPRPPKVPMIPAVNRVSDRKPRPPSMMTFATASTKIGEIPEHRLPLNNIADEPINLPMPFVMPAMLDAPKKRSRGLKFWKKGPVMQAAAA